jgi:hypothetical protein
VACWLCRLSIENVLSVCCPQKFPQIMFVPFLPLWILFAALGIVGLVTCCNTGCGCEPIHPDGDHHHHHDDHGQHNPPVVQYQYIAPTPAYQQSYQATGYQAPVTAPVQPAGYASVAPPTYGSAAAPPSAYASAPSVSEWSK